MKRYILLLGLLIILVALTTTSAAAQSPVGTAFTYQGKLADGGLPANGTYDLDFKLYDALSGGTQVGGTVIKDDVTVTAGLFTMQLDFGNVFDGTALYLEIGVRPGASGGAYTTLAPRQPLSATPYAIYSSKAPWSGLSGVPAGFADGVDNDTTYTAGEGLQLTGTQFQGKGSPYQNVVIVAKSGGDFTTITTALASITDASASNHYLIYVAPGVYNERVTMKPYVDIEGAGELTTKITFAGSAASNTGTVVGANNAELRFLTVENTGGDTSAIAIYNSGASPRLTHVTVTASGGTSVNAGVYDYYSSSPTMMDVTITVAGGSFSNGVDNSYSSSPRMTNVVISASGATYNTGVYIRSSSPTLTHVTATASGGTYSYGVYNNNNSLTTMTDVAASASGGATNNYGVINGDASMTINNSIISASGGTNNIGIYAYIDLGGSFNMLVNNSQITGNTTTISTVANYTTRLGASQLSGGSVIGAVTCAGVYDENYAFYASTCP